MKTAIWKKAIALLTCTTLVLSFAACGTAASSSPPTSTAPVSTASKTAPSTTSKPTPSGEHFRIAFLFPGLINDNGWNATAYQALKTMEGQGHETAYTEGVKVDSIEETFRNYAEAGYNILVGHGFEFGEPALMVAASYPDVQFCITGKMPDGAAATENVNFVEYKEYEAAYVSGMFAAASSTSGKVGFITGETNPTQLAGLAAFTNGARYINPEITIMGVVTGTFDDPAKGQETAKAQIEGGADVIAQSASQTGIGAMEAAAGKDVYVIGNGQGQNEMFPNNMIANYYTDTYQLVVSLIQTIVEGGGGGVWRPGLAEGVEVFEVWKEDAISAENKKMIEARIGEIEDGSYVVEEIHERIDQ